MLRLFTTTFLILAMAAAVTACGRTGTALPSTAGGPQVRTLLDELAELDALRAPEGVDAGLFAELKQSLTSLLRAKAGADGRVVSAVPAGSAGAVTDLHFDIVGTLRWSYVNRGDYDLNSEVNGADIAPVAAHFRKNSASPDWADKAAAADGDGNGEINSADIVPIAGNFRGKVDGYVIQASADGESGWNDVNEVPFAESNADGAGRSFQHALAAPVNGHWYAVVPLGQGARGERGNAVQYAAPAPQVVSVSPLSGREGAEVQFAAVVNGPAPDTYSWEFGGAAAPDTSSEQSPSVTFGAPGSYGASLTVSNTEGEDIFSFTLTVNANQSPTASFTADPQSGSPGDQTTLDASASFDPDGAVVHYEWDLDGDQNFETDGGANPTLDTTLPDPAGSVEVALRVTDDSGAMDIATLELSSANLPPVASFTATPQSGIPGTPVQLDASASSDPDGSIVQYEWDLDGDGSYETDSGAAPTRATALPDPVGSVPVGLRVTDNLGAQDTTSLDLTSNNSSPVPPTWIVPPSPPTILANFTLASVNGRPTVVFSRGISPAIFYCRANDADGSSWPEPQQVTAGDWEGAPYLLEVNGAPAICYHNDAQNKGRIEYMRANDPDGASWATPIELASGNPMDNYTSLAIVNGHPAVLWVPGAAGLRYRRALDPLGTTWGTTKAVDLDGVWTPGPTLQIVNGKPAVGYIGTAGSVRRARYCQALDVDGDNWNSPVDISNTEVVFSLRPGSMLTIAGGRPAIVFKEGAEPYNFLFCRAADADGTAWETPLPITTALTSHGYGVVTVGGISFVSTSSAEGHIYMEALNPEGSAWSSQQTYDPDIAESDTGGRFVAEIGGAPAIVYLSQTEFGGYYGLKYFKLR